jgi:hypothetical protein
MKFVLILMLGAVATLGSCKSSGNAAAQAAAERCICGTPEADFEGCPHPLCLKGERNPDNPDCVCGPLKLSGKK